MRLIEFLRDRNDNQFHIIFIINSVVKEIHAGNRKKNISENNEDLIHMILTPASDKCSIPLATSTANFSRLEKVMGDAVYFDRAPCSFIGRLFRR